MTIRHLRIFLAVCQNRCNTTQAAREMHMTQPAVSLAIRELERYYGVRLFDRIGRRLQITAAGERLRSFAERINSTFNDMEYQMRNWDEVGMLRVGASYTIGSQFLPGYIRAFRQRFSEAEVKVQVGPSQQLERGIMTNELDVALIEGVPLEPLLVSRPYAEDHLAVVGAVGSPFADKRTLSLEQFKRQRFLLREKGSGTRETFDHAVEAAGLSIEPIWEATSTTALLNAAIAGIGLAVLPKRMVEPSLRRGEVIELKVEGLEFRRFFYIVYHKDKYLSPAMRVFLSLCRE